LSGITTVITTRAALDAEDVGGEALAAYLQVDCADTWPPEHNDSGTRAWFRDLLDRYPDQAGFGARYIVVDGRLVGTCGFKGPPDAKGNVELGYSVVLAEQRKGYATAAVEILVADAFRDERVMAVLAETLPGLLASQKVLLRAGFLPNGARIDPDEGEVICFRRTRNCSAQGPECRVVNQPGTQSRNRPSGARR
jgi:[ribosomal protein S5]-alanine N-acetyltransferase